MHYRVFDTYNSCCQVWITTRPKLVLTNFVQSCLCGLWCVWQPNPMLNYVRCSKFVINNNNNKSYHYIVESIAYLPVPGGIFPYFLKALSFPSSTKDFHSLDGIIGERSYLGFMGSFLGEPYIALRQSSYVVQPSIGPLMYQRYLFRTDQPSS